jgi:hypothetical protein
MTDVGEECVATARPAHDSAEGERVSVDFLEKARAHLPDSAADRIAELKAERAELLAEKKRVQKDLKNEERKRRRLVEKARNLSMHDLATVLGVRVAAAASKAKPKAKAKAQAKAKEKAGGEASASD